MKHKIAMSIGFLICSVNLFTSLTSTFVCINLVSELDVAKFDITYAMHHHTKSNDMIEYLEESGVTNLPVDDISNILYMPEDRVDKLLSINDKLTTVTDSITTNIVVPFCILFVLNFAMLIVFVYLSINKPTGWD